MNYTKAQRERLIQELTRQMVTYYPTNKAESQLAVIINTVIELAHDCDDLEQRLEREQAALNREKTLTDALLAKIDTPLREGKEPQRAVQEAPAPKTKQLLSHTTFFNMVKMGDIALSNAEDATVHTSWKAGGQDFYAYGTLT